MSEETKKHLRKVIIFVFLYICVITLSAFILIPNYQPFGFIIWIFISFSGVILFVRWHTQNTAYICPECGYAFTITTSRSFISPHMWRRKLLRCPKCGERNWCLAVSVKEIM